MAEYDAFGRKIEGTEGQPTPAEEDESSVSASAGEPSEPLELASVVVSAGGGAPARMIVGVFIFITVVGAGVVGALVAFNSGSSSSSSSPGVSVPVVFPEDTETDAPQPEEPAEPAEPAKPPTGLGPRSLIREENFAKAVRRLRRSGIGRLTNLRVAADRIDAQLKTAKGELSSVQVGYKLDLRRFSTTGPGFDSVPTFPFSAIETSAPQRLARESVKRRGVSVKRVDYLVITKFSDDVIWSLFFNDSVHYVGDRSGHFVRKL
jgi:hypothetical protein